MDPWFGEVCGTTLLPLPRSPGPRGWVPHRQCSYPGRSTTVSDFNRVNDELTEQLVRGREDIFLGYEFAIQGGGKTLPDDALEYYFALFSDPEVLRGSFGFYRAWDTTLAQNDQRATRPLAMPVLAIGGAESWGEAVGNLATDGRRPRSGCCTPCLRGPADGAAGVS